MTTENINIPSLMRKARKAVSNENFEEAVQHYSLLMLDPEMKDLLDIKTRYAFCVEQTGDIPKAVEIYQEIVTLYKDSGEVGAAKALELKISIILKLANNESDSVVAVASIEEKVERGVSEQDIFSEETSGANLDFADLSLDTQDISPIEVDDATHDLTEKIAVEQELPAHPSKPSGIGFTEGTTSEEEQVLESKDESSKPELQEPLKEVQEEILRQEAEQESESLDQLSKLIKKGIHKNLVRREGNPSGDIKLSRLKGYNANNLELEDGASVHHTRKKAKDTPETSTDRRLKETAIKLFGSSNVKKK